MPCRAVPRLIRFLFSLIDSSANVHLSKSVTKSTNWNVLAENIVNQKQVFSLERQSLFLVLASDTLERRVSERQGERQGRTSQLQRYFT